MAKIMLLCLLIASILVASSWAGRPIYWRVHCTLRHRFNALSRLEGAMTARANSAELAGAIRHFMSAVSPTAIASMPHNKMTRSATSRPMHRSKTASSFDYIKKPFAPIRL
jgi:hypothetical protein